MNDPNRTELNGKSNRPEVVVITSASAGVGRATAREFARHGAHIGLLARGRDGLEAARREVKEMGGRALALPTDVAAADRVEAAAAEIEEKFGPIDIWINNAMTSVFSPVKEVRPEEFKRVTEVTYLGVVYGTLAALKRMLPRDRGVIVQVGSEALIGAGAIVLGILSLAGYAPLTLILVALLAVGASILLAGTAVSGRMFESVAH